MNGPSIARYCASALVAWALLAAFAKHSLGEEPLHVRIDRLIATAYGAGEPAEVSADAAFLRRIWLDLAGRIPSADEARAFIADTAPDKRSRTIDRLLAAPTYARRMEDLFHVLLMERRGDHPAWRTFLRTSFEANKPWNEMAREILHPSGSDEDTRGAAFFYTKRLEAYGQNPIDYPGLTRDVGRLLLGVDLQCAQCHNHLFIDDYKQVEFQGLFAALQGITIRSGGDFPAIKEKPPAKKLEFVSVFEPTQQQVGPRVPFGTEFSIPAPTPAPKPAPHDSAEPFSPLALLAENLLRSELFARNIVNRLWFVMMGRGLVHPLDLHHSGNPASHPELLDLLAAEFVAHGYDIRWLLGELALSETYQRSSQLDQTQDVPPPESYRVALERRLSSEQLLESILRATSNEAIDDEKHQKLQAAFEKTFGNDPREPEVEIHATVAGALYLLNSDEVLELVRPQPGNLVQRLLDEKDVHALADELYLSLLTRFPSEEEYEELAIYLAKTSQPRDVALGHFAWAMLASMEFYVNH